MNVVPRSAQYRNNGSVCYCFVGVLWFCLIARINYNTDLFLYKFIVISRCHKGLLHLQQGYSAAVVDKGDYI